MNRFLASAVAIAFACAFVAVVSLGAEEPAVPRQGTVVLQDFDEVGSGFSFREGSFVKPESKAELYARIDLMLDLPHGLGANNPQVSPLFSGKGGIVDLGARPLDRVDQAPKEGYAPLLKPAAIVKGHSYGVVTADGEHYAKLEVLHFDPEEGLLEFRWQYQPKPTNVFDKPTE
jgi:hypothetical protein